MCINRFDEDTKISFLDLYSKVDAEVTLEDENSEVKSENSESDEDENLIPF